MQIASVEKTLENLHLCVTARFNPHFVCSINSTGTCRPAVQVNMKKVNMDVMQRWIAQRITSLLGFEDDIVVGTCVNYLSEEVSSMFFALGSPARWSTCVPYMPATFYIPSACWL